MLVIEASLALVYAFVACMMSAVVIGFSAIFTIIEHLGNSWSTSSIRLMLLYIIVEFVLCTLFESTSGMVKFNQDYEHVADLTERIAKMLFCLAIEEIFFTYILHLAERMAKIEFVSTVAHWMNLSRLVSGYFFFLLQDKQLDLRCSIIFPIILLLALFKLFIIIFHCRAPMVGNGDTVSDFKDKRSTLCLSLLISCTLTACLIHLMTNYCIRKMGYDNTNLDVESPRSTASDLESPTECNFSVDMIEMDARYGDDATMHGGNGVAPTVLLENLNGEEISKKDDEEKERVKQSMVTDKAGPQDGLQKKDDVKTAYDMKGQLAREFEEISFWQMLDEAEALEKERLTQEKSVGWFTQLRERLFVIMEMKKQQRMRGSQNVAGQDSADKKHYAQKK